MTYLDKLIANAKAKQEEREQQEKERQLHLRSEMLWAAAVDVGKDHRRLKEAVERLLRHRLTDTDQEHLRQLLNSDLNALYEKWKTTRTEEHCFYEIAKEIVEQPKQQKKLKSGDKVTISIAIPLDDEIMEKVKDRYPWIREGYSKGYASSISVKVVITGPMRETT